MPETPDWSAPPQAVIQSHLDLQVAIEAGANYQELIGAAGKRAVIVGLGLSYAAAGGSSYLLRGGITGVASDWLTGLQVAALAISPDQPSVYVPFPPGALVLTTGADLGMQLTTEDGGAATFVWMTQHYYYV